MYFYTKIKLNSLTTCICVWNFPELSLTIIKIKNKKVTLQLLSLLLVPFWRSVRDPWALEGLFGKREGSQNLMIFAKVEIMNTFSSLLPIFGVLPRVPYGRCLTFLFFFPLPFFVFVLCPFMIMVSHEKGTFIIPCNIYVMELHGCCLLGGRYICNLKTPQMLLACTLKPSHKEKKSILKNYYYYLCYRH